MIQLCFCGEAILPPRTCYCSETCRRRARKKKHVRTRKHARNAPQQEASPVFPATGKTGTPQKKAPCKDGRIPTRKEAVESGTPQQSETGVLRSVLPKGKKSISAKGALSAPLLSISSRVSSLPSPNKDQPLLLPLGRNMPANMPLLDAIHCACRWGYDTVQLFLSNPGTWDTPLLSPTLAGAVSQALSDAHFSSIVIHAPFRIDLSSEKERMWVNSILLLRATVEQARLIGASDVVAHLDNYKRAYIPISEGRIERIVNALTYVLSEGPGKPLRSVRLLLENGCNPHRSPGSKIEELGAILQALRPAYRQQVRVCLDTAHCWAAGYDLCSNMSQFLSLVEGSIGFPSIQLIHLNDARHELGSSRDEHAQWGMGQISMRSVSGIQVLLQDPRLAHVALILETPFLKNENGLPDWEQEREHHALVKRLLLTPL